MELFKLILPVFTFIGGYLLSSFDRIRESRRKLRNLKVILFKEMSQNFKLLNVVAPNDSKELPDPYLVAMMAQRFSFLVYDRYLDRLDSLRADELNRIYDACVSLKGFQNDGAAFLSAAHASSPGEPLGDTAAAQATLLVSQLQKSYELMQAALKVFAGGRTLLEGLEAERGAALPKHKEISSWLARERLAQP